MYIVVHQHFFKTDMVLIHSSPSKNSKDFQFKTKNKQTKNHKNEAFSQ